MAILVTGGTGYIGSHTVVELLNNNKDVVIVDNLCNSKVEVLSRIEQITGKKPKFYQISILDEDKLEEVFKNENIDSIIHFAGLKSVKESVLEPERYYHNNVEGSKVLFKLMIKYPSCDVDIVLVHVVLYLESIRLFCDSEFVDELLMIVHSVRLRLPKYRR